MFMNIIKTHYLMLLVYFSFFGKIFLLFNYIYRLITLLYFLLYPKVEYKDNFWRCNFFMIKYLNEFKIRNRL